MNFALLVDLARARWRFVVGLSVSLVGLSVLYLGMYPTLREQLEVFARGLPDAIRALIGDADLGTPEGYLCSEVFAITAPFLVAALAITIGVSLARSERDRTLISMFAAPLSRRTLALTHLTWTLVVALAGATVVLVTTVVGADLAGMGVSVAAIAAATLHLAAFSSAMGAVAFAGAAATGSPAVGLATGWGVTVAAFVTDSVSHLVDSAAWLADVSPWGWYGGGVALSEGVDPLGVGLLLTLTALAASFGIIAYGRRDLAF